MLMPDELRHPSLNYLNACTITCAVNIILYQFLFASQTYNLPDEHAAAYLKTKSVNHIVGKMKEKDQLEEHPDVQAFLDWKSKLAVRDAYG